MSVDPRRFLDPIHRTLSSVQTGIFLLIATVLASAAGTVILQRPLVDAGEMERAYSPATLQWLDRLGLTDVYHTVWFAGLLALLSLNIILASLRRLPNAWRYVARPYRRPETHFLAGLPQQKEIPIRAPASAIEAAERAFRKAGFKPQRVAKGPNTSLYAERNRFARLAAYVVHASLLLVFAGAIADALLGYRGFMALGRGEQSNEIEMRDGTRKALPFTIRCLAAGQENYADGSPRRWWSQLVVLEDGREVKQQEIAVNDPLVHRGLRFFQSSYGATGQLQAVRLTARPKNGATGRELALPPGAAVPLDVETTVELAAFVPDFVLAGNRIESRSPEPNNPAIQLRVLRKGQESKVWLFPRFPGFSHPGEAPYEFEFHNLETGYFTGLQVAYEPGQWAVWAGVLLMGAGLALAFYFVHVRVWAVPIDDGRGRMVLWVGASASKNRDEFARGFGKLTAAIEEELESAREACAPAARLAMPARPLVRMRG